MDPSVTFTYGILIGVLIGLLFKRYNDALWKWLEKLSPAARHGRRHRPQSDDADADPDRSPDRRGATACHSLRTGDARE